MNLIFFFKHILVPFKIYSDFECILNSVESCEGSCSKKLQGHILVLLLTNFSKLIVGYRDKNVAYKFIKAILEKYQYCKKVMKKTFQQKFDHD